MAEGLRRKARGVLAVASATARPRSPRVHLFRELLGFEVGTPSFALRKVADLYEEAFGLSQEALWARGAEWARRLGGGGSSSSPGTCRRRPPWTSPASSGPRALGPRPT